METNHRELSTFSCSGVRPHRPQADLIGNNLSTESTKTTIELNLAVLKITHEVTRTKRRK